MASLYFTGDTHQDISRFTIENFPEQMQMTGTQDENFVCITGDEESQYEKYTLDWLERRPFTTLFVSGNHENFDRLYSDKYPIREWRGGRAQFIRPHIIHLLRGEVYEILDKKIFTFGGASSHDIKDGVLEMDDERIYMWSKTMREFRINHWWKEEIASQEEMEHGINILAQHDNCVDFIVTHCLPQEIASLISCGDYKADKMTEYLQTISTNTKFKQWYCGHYHNEKKYQMQM